MSVAVPDGGTLLDYYRRYRGCVDAWPEFADCLTQPLSVVVRPNPKRIDGHGLAVLARAQGLHPRVLLGGEAVQFDHGESPGRHWWHVIGLAHSQEFASMLPARLLDARPGERVLDMCAAPGGKTAQIATQVGDRGSVVANDVHPARMRALRSTIERMNLFNVTTTCHDGASLPSAWGPFDRVLVDVPCSGDATVRKHAGARRWRRPDPGRANGLQQALLQRAIALCRPGGRVVYSTCSLAPEENEAVIDAVLRQAGGRVALAEVDAPGYRTDPGLTSWGGRRFHESMERCLRLWPHRQDSSGFFAAVLDKLGAPTEGASPTSSRGRETRDALAGLVEPFAIPAEALRHLQVVNTNSRGWFVQNRDHRPPSQWEARGLLAVRTTMRPPKLATASAWAWGDRAGARIAELDGDQCRRYLARQSLPLAELKLHDAHRGYVLARHGGFCLGLAWADECADFLHSQFPKRWAREGSSPPRLAEAAG